MGQCEPKEHDEPEFSMSRHSRKSGERKSKIFERSTARSSKVDSSVDP